MADMILPQPKDAVHKAWLYRLLIGICDDAVLADALAFKGGTCAAMLGYLDRFSIDLDFDYRGEPSDRSGLAETRVRLEKVFHILGLVIRDQSMVVQQYFLKYEAPEASRNTIKIDIAVQPPKANAYESKRFSEIDRIIACQTLETMVANKLVALTDRYERNESIAARDLYDIHHFFFRGYRYNEEVMYERTGKETPRFFTDLIAFIEQYITDEIINQDLNMLLPHERFSRIRKVLKRETLLFLRNEAERIAARGK